MRAQLSEDKDSLAAIITGAVQDNLDPLMDRLPHTYLAFAMRTPQHQFRRVLPHIERMAAIGLKPQTIADRLGIPLGVLEDAAKRFPDLDYAMKGGRARGIEEVSAARFDAARTGDMTAANAYLKGQGEDGSGASGPAVQINIGAQASPVDTARVIDMMAMQRDLPPPD